MGIWKRIVSGVSAMLMMCCFATMPVMAGKCTCKDGSEGVETIILGENGCSCDNGSGSGVTNILSTVVDILTVGVGILGVLGITIVGIQYLTAGGSEEKMKKAKQRMLEIVIGLVAYILIYALLKWLKVA